MFHYKFWKRRIHTVRIGATYLGILQGFWWIFRRVFFQYINEQASIPSTIEKQLPTYQIKSKENKSGLLYQLKSVVLTKILVKD